MLAGELDPQKYVQRYEKHFRLDDILELSFKEMSLGQKKKLFATVNLIDEAKVWILDEPTNGLDALAISAFQKAIKVFSQQGIVILAEHKQEFLTAFANLKILPF